MGLSPDPNPGPDPQRPMVQIGDVLADKYVVERLLGVGGMGVVVAARHRELNELRAIKLMRRDAAVDSDAVERFLREARAAVRLKSEHAVNIHDVGRLPSGEPYMVMEHLDGSDLKMILRRRGPLPAVETVGLGLQALEAIAEAHAMGIVHRDLKPGNLFVTTGIDGEPVVKVLDFGISKLTGAIAAGAGMDMTKTSSMLGTPYYMSPEQMRSSRQVDVRTDVWALGVILYQLLTGRVPFKENTITALCASVLQDEPIPPRDLRRDLSAELEQVVLRCLQKKVEARYTNVADLAVALEPFGPPGSQASVGRIQRLLGAAGAPGGTGSYPSVSAAASGALASLSGPAEPADVEQLMPTTPLRAPSIVDSTATAASWGRTGPLDRSRMPAGTKAVLAAVGVSALVLVAFLAIVLPGSPDGDGSGATNGHAGAAGEETSSSDVAVVGVSSGEIDLDDDTSAEAEPSDGGAEADGGQKKSVRRPWRRPRPKPKPDPNPDTKPDPGDPFGPGRK